jgi:hypothetical protein
MDPLSAVRVARAHAALHDDVSPNEALERAGQIAYEAALEAAADTGMSPDEIDAFKSAHEHASDGSAELEQYTTYLNQVLAGGLSWLGRSHPPHVQVMQEFAVHANSLFPRVHGLRGVEAANSVARKRAKRMLRNMLRSNRGTTVTFETVNEVSRSTAGAQRGTPSRKRQSSRSVSPEPSSPGLPGGGTKRQKIPGWSFSLRAAALTAIVALGTLTGTTMLQPRGADNTSMYTNRNVAEMALMAVSPHAHTAVQAVSLLVAPFQQSLAPLLGGGDIPLTDQQKFQAVSERLLAGDSSLSRPRGIETLYKAEWFGIPSGGGEEVVLAAPKLIREAARVVSMVADDNSGRYSYKDKQRAGAIQKVLTGIFNDYHDKQTSLAGVWNEVTTGVAESYLRNPEATENRFWGLLNSLQHFSERTENGDKSVRPDAHVVAWAYTANSSSNRDSYTVHPSTEIDQEIVTQAVMTEEFKAVTSIATNDEQVTWEWVSAARVGFKSAAGDSGNSKQRYPLLSDLVAVTANSKIRPMVGRERPVEGGEWQRIARYTEDRITPTQARIAIALLFVSSSPPSASLIDYNTWVAGAFDATSKAKGWNDMVTLSNARQELAMRSSLVSTRLATSLATGSAGGVYAGVLTFAANIALANAPARFLSVPSGVGAAYTAYAYARGGDGWVKPAVITLALAAFGLQAAGAGSLRTMVSHRWIRPDRLRLYTSALVMVTGAIQTGLNPTLWAQMILPAGTVVMWVLTPTIVDYVNRRGEQGTARKRLTYAVQASLWLSGNYVVFRAGQAVTPAIEAFSGEVSGWKQLTALAAANAIVVGTFALGSVANKIVSKALALDPEICRQLVLRTSQLVVDLEEHGQGITRSLREDPSLYNTEQTYLGGDTRSSDTSQTEENLAVSAGRVAGMVSNAMGAALSHSTAIVASGRSNDAIGRSIDRQGTQVVSAYMLATGVQDEIDRRCAQQSLETLLKALYKAHDTTLWDSIKTAWPDVFRGYGDVRLIPEWSNLPEETLIIAIFRVLLLKAPSLVDTDYSDFYTMARKALETSGKQPLFTLDARVRELTDWFSIASDRAWKWKKAARTATGIAHEIASDTFSYMLERYTGVSVPSKFVRHGLKFVPTNLMGGTINSAIGASENYLYGVDHRASLEPGSTPAPATPMTGQTPPSRSSRNSRRLAWEPAPPTPPVAMQTRVPARTTAVPPQATPTVQTALSSLPASIRWTARIPPPAKPSTTPPKRSVVKSV